MPLVQWDQVPEFYHRYIKQVPVQTLEAAFDLHATALPNLLADLDETQWDYSYGPGKWTIREVVQHIIDTERIFAYRALAFARGEAQSLPGFDENEYASRSGAERRTKESLLKEFSLVQQSSEILFLTFTEQQLSASGMANNNRIYVAGIGFALVGHCQHHLRILEERYLPNLVQTDQL